MLDFCTTATMQNKMMRMRYLSTASCCYSSTRTVQGSRVRNYCASHTACGHLFCCDIGSQGILNFCALHVQPLICESSLSLKYPVLFASTTNPIISTVPFLDLQSTQTSGITQMILGAFEVQVHNVEVSRS